MIPVYNLVRPDESYMVVSLPSIQLTPNNDLRRWAGGRRLLSTGLSDQFCLHFW